MLMVSCGSDDDDPVVTPPSGDDDDTEVPAPDNSCSVTFKCILPEEFRKGKIHDLSLDVKDINTGKKYSFSREDESNVIVLGVLAFSPILLVAQLRQLGFEAKTSERPADNGKKIHNLFEKCLIALSWLMVFISLFIVISESQFEFYTTSIVIALAVFVYCFLNCFAKAFCSIRHIGAGKP